MRVCVDVCGVCVCVCVYVCVCGCECVSYVCVIVRSYENPGGSMKLFVDP